MVESTGQFQDVAPFYQDESCTIYNADCKEVLYFLSGFQCVVTDPPYCSGGFNESGKKAAAGMGLRSETIREVGWFVNDNMTTAGIGFLLAHVAAWSKRGMAAGGTFTAFTDWRMISSLTPAIESAGLRFQSLLVWEKPNPGLGTGFRPCHELAMHFSNGTPEYFSNSGSNVIKCKRVLADDKVHQTQKPVGLISEIISVVSAPGQTILDPFMGSGTTLLAAKLEGRKAVGIEISEKYCELAANRLRQKVLF